MLCCVATQPFIEWASSLDVAPLWTRSALGCHSFPNRERLQPGLEIGVACMLTSPAGELMTLWGLPIFHRVATRAALLLSSASGGSTLSRTQRTSDEGVG